MNDDIEQIHIELAFNFINDVIQEYDDDELRDSAILGLQLLYEQASIYQAYKKGTKCES